MLLPVGAVAATIVAAAEPGAALAFTESARVFGLSSGVEIRRSVRRPLPGVQVVTEISLRQVLVQLVQQANRNLRVGDLVDSVGSSDVIEGVHVVDGGAVLPAGQQVSGSDYGHLLRLEEFPNPAVECSQILHGLLTGVHRGGVGAPDVGAVL